MKKVLFIFCLCAVTFVGLRFYSAPFLSLKDFHLVADAFFSSEYCAAVSKQIFLLTDQNISAYTTIDKISKEFSLIDKMTIAFQPLQTLITINAHPPICVINDTHMLMANNDVCSKSVFSTSAIADVPVVSVQPDSMRQARQLLPSIFNILPSHFHDSYNLMFVNSHCIQLIDKKNPLFTIFSEAEQKDYSTLLPQCQSIKESLVARGAFDKNVAWIADCRFAHYIIVYKA